MLERRYIQLQKFIMEGKWLIDLNKGIVQGRNKGQGCPDKDGYLSVRVYDNHKGYKYMVHEIIAVAGGLCPIGNTIDHINGDKQDNRLSNLQILSREENSSKANKGRTDILRGSAVKTSKLTEQQVLNIKTLLVEGSLTQQQMADHFNITQTMVSRISRGKAWSHVGVVLC